jgi:hypothetical protein
MISARRLSLVPLLLPVLSLVAVAVGCTLTTDLDGLTSSGVTTPDSAAIDASVVDTGTNDGGQHGDAGLGDASADARFVDDFNRADGPLGNGWLEGVPGTYLIKSNGVSVQGAGLGFEKNYAYRPADPAFRDIEASIEFTPTSLPPSYPQVQARATPGAAFTGYAAAVSDATDKINWGRGRPGDVFFQLGETTLSEAIVVGERYRLALSVSGVSPVHIAITLERATVDGWTAIGGGATDDTANDRITEAGMFGFSVDGDPNYTFDNFVAAQL